MIPNYYEKQEKDIRERWFPNHVAKFSTVEAGRSSLTWRKPETSNYYCRYLIEGQFLIVFGDIGEAVYQWSDQITWEFLSGLDLQYFAGKCQASAHGRGYKTWDAEMAKSKLDDYFSLYPDDEVKWADVHGCDENLFSQMDWSVFLVQHGYDVFGDDLSSISKIGEVIDIQSQGHLVGLKMAYGQALANEAERSQKKS